MFRLLILTFFLFLPQLSQAAFDSATQAQQKDLRITRITPSGEDVMAGRQLVVTFNRPVVPVGKMERDSSDIPIDISPALNCQWRWLNTNSLACQLDQENAMQPATHYKVTVNPGITAEDGAKLNAPYEHRFITARPKVRYARFRHWSSPGTPEIHLRFNQPVSRSSVLKTLAFEYALATQNKAIKPRVEPIEDDLINPYFITTPGDSYILELSEEKDPEKQKNMLAQAKGEEARYGWKITPRKELPLDTAIFLNIAPGLESALGKELGIEKRTVTQFHSFPELTFLGLHCATNDDNYLTIEAHQSADQGKCSPRKGVSLVFSSPVQMSQIKDNIVIDPDLADGRKDFDPWANQREGSYLKGSRSKDHVYYVYLPQRLLADKHYKIQSKEAKLGFFERIFSWLFSWIKPSRETDIRDEFGRPLMDAIDLSFFTDHRPPNYELNYSTVVLESQTDSEIPLYVTNIDEITLHYDRLIKNSKKANQTHQLEIPKVKNLQFGLPMQIRQLLDGKSGALYGHISSKPEVPHHRRSSFFAVISPYEVHVKFGHFNTLIWVTDMATGKPVNNAEVSIHLDTLSGLHLTPDIMDKASTDVNGIATLKGSHEFDPHGHHRYCYNTSCERFFIRVEKGEELAIIPLDGRFEINTYRVSNDTVWSYRQKKHGHMHSWGTTAQGVYRLGDVMQFKFYVRDQNNETLVAPERGKYTLTISDPTGKTVHEIKEFELSAFGSYSGEFTIPKNGAMGWYRFALTADYTDHSWSPMHVLISDFTPSPFKVHSSVNGDLFHPGQTLEIHSAATLHSGGAYTDAQARVTATLRSKYFSSSHPVASNFTFDSYRNRHTEQIFQHIGPVDDKGEITHQVPMKDHGIVYGAINVETAVRDDRGKYIAAQANAHYIGVDRLVGLRNTKWVYEAGKPAKVEYIVVDDQGKPVKGVKVNTLISRKETKTSKVKTAGNSYKNQYITNWIETGKCEGASEDAAATCQFTPDKPGSYKITATITDTKGKPHQTDIHAWVTGKGQVVWQEPDSNALQIVPEKDSYQIGDTARYLIKNPYPGAKALISIERYGVLKHWVQDFTDSTAIVEFEVEKDFMPGYYLSVMVFSPRVEVPLPKLGEVDLGKPGFKMGYLEVKVKDPYKQMDITISTDKKHYKPRDIVKARIYAKPKNQDKKEPVELAVVVLDEAVLDLVKGGENYFDPYEGFYHLDGLDVQNYSLLTRLLGRQKFEKKGANPGGDGGAEVSIRSEQKNIAFYADSIVLEEGAGFAAKAVAAPQVATPEIRSQVKDSAYWQGKISVDKDGYANIEFRAPDNLTGWRILVLAVTPSDRMGLGSGSFKVNRPTEIRPAMPNQVMEGDQFDAAFTVMNRTDQTRTLDIAVFGKGTVAQEISSAQSITLEPYKRQTVKIPVKAGKVTRKAAIKSGDIHFTVTAKDATDGDGMEHYLKVMKRRSYDIGADYGTTTQETMHQSLAFPTGIHTDVGDVSVVLSPTVIGNIDGAFDYMRDYPYGCWEQKLSKAVMASHYQNLRDYLPDDLSWDNSAKLPQDMLHQAANHQAPNGGMSFYVAKDHYVSPYLSAYTALAFNWLDESGYTIPEAVEEKLHQYLLRFLRKDIVPEYYSTGMTSTVRAVALAALSKHGKITQSDLNRYRDHAKHMSLFGKAHYLKAALRVKNNDTLVYEVADMILASATQSGGTFSFNETLDDGYTRILSTPTRTQCSILSALTAFGEQDRGSQLIGDIPFKLVRHITKSRGKRHYWQNTQENLFCLNALTDYSRGYEHITPNMKVDVLLGEEKIGKAKFKDLRDDPVTVSREIKPSDPGQKTSLVINRKGDGRLYFATRMRYALKEENAERVNAGIDIRKEYSVERDGKWIVLEQNAPVKQGELIRVDIFASLPTARHFVVVDDPVPGGLEPVNRNLATASVLDANKASHQAAGGSWYFQFDDWRHYDVSRWSFYHQEIGHDAVRFYSDYLPAGNYYLSYAAQVIATGTFQTMPVHAEEMYDPDIYGKGLPGKLTVTTAE